MYYLPVEWRALERMWQSIIVSGNIQESKEKILNIYLSEGI